MPIGAGGTRRAICLDRDGVINVYRPEYVRVPEDFEYYPGIAEAFALLGEIGLPVVVVTNQSGIGRGYTTLAVVEGIHDRLLRDAAAWGGSITGIEVCPHRPDETCRCRKPAPILFERLAARHHLRWKGSYMVGDSPSDIDAGRRLGMVTVRVSTGRGQDPGPVPDQRVRDLLEAVRWIAQREGARH